MYELKRVYLKIFGFRNIIKNYIKLKNIENIQKVSKGQPAGEGAGPGRLTSASLRSFHPGSVSLGSL